MPDLRLARYRCDIADLLILDGVDDATLTDIGIAYKAYADLFLIGHEVRKLAQQLDKGAFAEGVVDGSVESNSRMCF